MKLTDEEKYYEYFAPYFVKDSLNKDSFLIPAPNLLNAFYVHTVKSTQINLFDN